VGWALPYEAWRGMAITGHTLHLDEQDMKTSARFARAESKAIGICVMAAGTVRRLIKECLRPRGSDKGKP